MSGPRRFLLIWLLAVLLPLQGWAAATGLPCGPGQHAPSLQAGPPVDPMAGDQAPARGEHASMGHSAGHDPHDAHAAAGAADIATPAGAHPAPPDSTHTCSACAACCPGMAPPSALATVASLPTADPASAVPGTGTASAVIGGLERPPRATVA